MLAGNGNVKNLDARRSVSRWRKFKKMGGMEGGVLAGGVLGGVLAGGGNLKRWAGWKAEC